MTPTKRHGGRSVLKHRSQSKTPKLYPQEVRCQDIATSAVKDELKRRLKEAGHPVELDEKIRMPILLGICRKLGVPTEVPREIAQCRQKSIILDSPEQKKEIVLGACHYHLKIKLDLDNRVSLDELIAAKMNEWKRAHMDLVSPALLSLRRVITESPHDPSVVKASTFVLQNTPGLLPERNPVEQKPTKIEVTQNNFSNESLDLLSPQALANFTDEERETLIRLLAKARDNMRLALPPGPVIAQEAGVEGVS